MLNREWSRSKYWLCHFLQNRHERLKVNWQSPVDVAPGLRPALCRWLSAMARGQHDGGRWLIGRAVEECSQDPAYVQSLRLYVKEEHFHTKCLLQALERFGGAGGYWHLPRGPIVSLRHAVGMRFDLSVLLLDQIIDAVLCQVVAEACSDEALRSLCAQIRRDKDAHLGFHAERLTLEFADFNFLRRNLRRLRLRAMFAGAVATALAEHEPILRAAGWTHWHFTRTCWVRFATVLERMVPYRRDALVVALLRQENHPYDKPVRL